MLGLDVKARHSGLRQARSPDVGLRLELGLEEPFLYLWSQEPGL